jgi:hypothetical protein
VSHRQFHELPVMTLDRRRPPFPAPAVEHIPRRPMWSCRACDDPWPCGIARLLLKGQYEPDPVGLPIFMCGQLCEAMRDIYRLHPNTAPPPQAMFDRFVGWTRRTPFST